MQMLFSMKVYAFDYTHQVLLIYETIDFKLPSLSQIITKKSNVSLGMSVSDWATPL